MADSILAVVGARFADRVGKGLRGAPRDALVADVTPKETLGAAYGVRQSMDAAGAFVGPLLATILLFYPKISRKVELQDSADAKSA